MPRQTLTDAEKLTATFHDALMQVIQEENIIDVYEAEDIAYALLALAPMMVGMQIFPNMQNMDVLEVNHFANRLIVQNQ